MALKKTNDSQVSVYVPISAVFPNVKNDIKTFRAILAGLSRTDTLFWCARLTLVLSTELDVDEIERQKFGLKQFFSLSEIRAISNFIVDNGGIERVKVFFRGQLLELFRWVALYYIDHPGDGATYEDPEVRRRFGQAALIASDIWKKRVFQDKFSLDGGIELARKRALGPIRQSMEATKSSQELAQTLGRGWILFNEYFPRYYNSFYKDFLAATQMSAEQYFIIFAMMITHYMDPTSNSGIFSIQDALRDHKNVRDLFCKYVELESQSAEELRLKIKQDEAVHPAGSYRSLREKPILRTDDGRAIIIDPVFFAEKGSIGPLFHILKSPTCRHRDVFTAFGQAFEEYILDILNRMFSSSTNLVNRFSENIEAVDSEGKSIEIDGMLNDVFQIVLFEVKAGFIPEQAILSDEYESLLQIMRERYSTTETKEGKTKLKGVGQLARAAVSIATGRWKGNNDELQSVRTVYPVLVLHDDLLTSPVYGDFFASEFSDRLQECSSDKESSIEDRNIKISSVITLSVSDLEYLEVAIEHFRFCDLLADYSESCPDRLMSLYNFIASSEKYSFYYNRNLASKGIEVLDKARDFLSDRTC